jgi:hypothetical protein
MDPHGSTRWFSISVSALVMVLVLFLAGCGQSQATPTPAPTGAAQSQPTSTVPPQPAATLQDTPSPSPAATEEPESALTQEPEATVTPTPQAICLQCPFEDAWAGSGHANGQAEAFTHWNEDQPPEIPITCAKCHSTNGYRDYMGADGSTPREVNNPVPAGNALLCIACHNQATIDIGYVIFPSGDQVHNLGPEAQCMQCHQGTSSTPNVREIIAQAGVTSPDEVSDQLTFVNPHYTAAAATQYGGVVEGGYEYEGKSYDVKFPHTEGLDSCLSCHATHALDVEVAVCGSCHTGVTDSQQLTTIRTKGSLVDFDGDGNLSEGIAVEVDGVREVLYTAIQSYAANTAGSPVIYDGQTYPYWFIDTNANGQLDQGENAFQNRYASWTERLVKATYNYTFSDKDPGDYAHGAKYVIELLYDSTEDLDPALAASLTREDVGHFDGAAVPWRHFDEDGVIPADCSQCHSPAGVPFLMQQGVTISEPPSDGMECTTCHNEIPEFTRYAPEQVAFPSGAQLSFENTDPNLCLFCHQGRESTATVNAAIDDLPLDTPAPDQLAFINTHYFQAGATLFGSEAMGMYQYSDQTYAGRFPHVAGFDTCIACHDTHRLAVKFEACQACHPSVQSPQDLGSIRMTTPDVDGDGDTEEGVADEVATMHDALYGAIQRYAAQVIGSPIVYSGAVYPYFFNDTNGNGEPDADETTFPNRYALWTPRLVRTAYNYQYVAKDPGAYAHNATYVLQALFDSLSDLAQQVEVNQSEMFRP